MIPVIFTVKKYIIISLVATANSDLPIFGENANLSEYQMLYLFSPVLAVGVASPLENR
jgi:hypothetical protein